MAGDLVADDYRKLLLDELVKAFVVIDDLKIWLATHLPIAQPQLSGVALDKELVNLITWADAQDGMRDLLQRLVDNPPSDDGRLQHTIYVVTAGKIRKQEATLDGLPVVDPHLSWFAADRPFVNRESLRSHLGSLDSTPAGAQCILVIDGDHRSGKSFAVSLAISCKAPDHRNPTIDIDEFARYASIVDAAELARLIADTKEDFPPYDPTKENEAIPHLNLWLVHTLKKKHLWIIIDHCDRKVLTDGARELLKLLAERIRNAELPNVRLILVDFDRSDFPQEWRDQVRYDTAVLPDSKKVQDWCCSLAAAAKRKHSVNDAQKWVTQIFDKLAQKDPEDGSWQGELEVQLQEAFQTIMNLEKKP